MQIATLAQGLHLGDKSLLQHGIKALCNARMQPLAVARLQRQKQIRRRGRLGLRLLRVPKTQRLAGHVPHFQRATNALAVVRLQPGGRFRIDACQLRMHGRPAVRCCLR